MRVNKLYLAGPMSWHEMFNVPEFDLAATGRPPMPQAHHSHVITRL